jgi:cellulose synthase/poly-beta-1,6-N-acetylglucosamine synthase-like glycosyltransferase
VDVDHTPNHANPYFYFLYSLFILYFYSIIFFLSVSYFLSLILVGPYLINFLKTCTLWASCFERVGNVIEPLVVDGWVLVVGWMGLAHFDC